METLESRKPAKVKRLKEQGAKHVYKDMLRHVMELCFPACTSLPKAHITEESLICFHNCADRYFEARNLVVHGYIPYAGYDINSNSDDSFSESVEDNLEKM